MEESDAVKLTLHKLETTAKLAGVNSNIYYNGKF